MFTTNLAAINLAWETGVFDFIKGLQQMNSALQISSLLPQTVSVETLEAIAMGMYSSRKVVGDDFDSLGQSYVEQNNPLLLAQQELSFVAPKKSSLMDTSLIFSHLLELKQPHGCGPNTTQQFAFIETLTASERLRNQLILDQSVTVNGRVHCRTPCSKGRPGDGYVGCALYQIDSLVTGTLGIYLSKGETDIFYETGAMPTNASGRVCILCYSQLLTCRAGLFGVRGVGSADYMDMSMYYQDLVNCADGYQSKFMILPGSGGIFPLAPFLSFHPRHLLISMRGGEKFVDESAMWYAPLPGFQPGAAC